MRPEHWWERSGARQDSTTRSPCACFPTTDWSLWNYNSVSEQHVRSKQSIRTVQHVVHALVPHHRLVTVELQQCVRTACQDGTEHLDSPAHRPCACSPNYNWSLWNYNSVAQHVRMEQYIRTAQHTVYVLVPPPLTGHCGITTV